MSQRLASPPDCDEAEVCTSQRRPESGTDKDRLIVGSRFWSPPLGGLSAWSCCRNAVSCCCCCGGGGGGCPDIPAATQPAATSTSSLLPPLLPGGAVAAAAGTRRPVRPPRKQAAGRAPRETAAVEGFGDAGVGGGPGRPGENVGRSAGARPGDEVPRAGATRERGRGRRAGGRRGRCSRGCFPAGGPGRRETLRAGGARRGGGTEARERRERR